jgi:hypothetical protein
MECNVYSIYVDQVKLNSNRVKYSTIFFLPLLAEILRFKGQP